MPAHASVVTNAGTTLSISAALPATYDAAGYGAVGMTYTAVGEIEDHGSHGVSSSVSNFTDVATATIRKSKGPKNYGQKILKIGNISGDAGQIILEAASESNAHYSVKIEYEDGEINYLDILVSKYERNDGTAENTRTIACTLDVCRKPVIVAAA